MRLGSALLLCCIVSAASACSEVCDDDVDNDGNGFVDCGDPVCGLFPGCTSCGDGVLDDAEACDDGDVRGGDSCDERCRKVGCGDGEKSEREACDDGNLVRGDGCDDRCEIDFCGDGVVQTGEECDDGDVEVGDGCGTRCTIERGALCGNFAIDPGETCDDGNRVSGDGCSRDCTPEFCGDGVRQPRLGEQCDGRDVEEGAVCVGCVIDRCGNGRVDPGELCDDGNTISGDDCTGCKPARCGNGILENDEQCDDGNANNDDGCNASCRVEFCGDGIVNGSEDCDGGFACLACDLTSFDDGDLSFVVSGISLESLFGGIGGMALGRGVMFVQSPNQGVVFRYTQFDDDFALLDPALVSNVGPPVIGDLDGESHADFAGCAQQAGFAIFADPQLNVSFTGMFCTSVVLADVNHVGHDDIVALQGSLLSVFLDPLSVGQITQTPFPGTLASGLQAGVNVEGDVVVAASTGELFRYDHDRSSFAPIDGRSGVQLVAADVDGDGVGELVSALGSTIEIGDDVIADSPLSPKRIAAGDIDGDARADVVVIGATTATFLLSTRDYAAIAPFPVPTGTFVAVDRSGVVFVGGKFNQPGRAFRIRVEER